MSVGLFLAAVGLGVLVGVWVVSWVVGRWAASEAGRRRLALVNAENRVRDAQVDALNRLADVAAEAVYDQTSGGPTRWPSESVVDGELVPYDEDRS